VTHVKRVVICDAFVEPAHHYRVLADGTSRLTEGRRSSVSVKADTGDLTTGFAGAKVKAEMSPALFDQPLFEEDENVVVNLLRAEVRAWREGGYQGTARVTRRLLEWWFERPDERHARQTRFFFCQQEAVETVIYLYEVRSTYRFKESGDLLRYALKLATGTGKTLVMAMLITWSTLHKVKVSNSPLSSNFLVLVPNLTVRARVSGDPRGDGIVQSGPEDLFHVMELLPPEYEEGFLPRVMVHNWQSIPLESQRDDWISESALSGRRFVSYSVLRAIERRARRDPRAPIRKLLKGCRDLMILNDEAHHAYGEKKVAGGESGSTYWHKVLSAVREVVDVPLVVDMSATPWYGSGSPKPEGTLFEWLVSDFSVYDAFESGLVKVVRLPEADDAGAMYLDLYDRVKDAKTKDEFLSSARGAIETIYSSWKEDFQDWSMKFDMFKDAQPVLLLVAADSKRAGWIFEYLTEDPAFALLHNVDPDDVSKWATIEVNSKVFDADAGKAGTLREMVNTVGKHGAPGEQVLAIVAVDMLSEGWDVKSVSHIIGFRRFGSPLLTEQVIGRGLRRTDYSTLYTPLEERHDDSYETVDALGIPFIGMPVQRTRRRIRSDAKGKTPIPIESESAKRKFRVRVPNVKSWAVGVSTPLSEVIDVGSLRQLVVDPKSVPTGVKLKPIVGDDLAKEITLDAFRDGTPVTALAMACAADLMRRTAVEDSEVPGVGPTFEELLEVVQQYLHERVVVKGDSDLRDVWIPYFRHQLLDTLDTAIRGAGSEGLNPVPMLADPPHLDTDSMKPFRWVSFRAAGKKTQLSHVACDSPLEEDFASFLDEASDVGRYVKNERFGFSVTYFEGGRPRQYYPDFVVVTGRDDDERWSLVETKGEIWPNTDLKRQAAEKWCRMMTDAKQGDWRYVFVHQPVFEKAVTSGVSEFAELEEAIETKERARSSRPSLTLIKNEADVPRADRFVTMLPVYSVEAAAGHFGESREVDLEGWIEVAGALTEDMFVARVVGHSMEPRIFDGSLCVFKKYRGGTRQGKIVLAQYHGPNDPDTGGAYTVKRYTSEKSIDLDTGELTRISVTLQPDNRDYEPIELAPEFEDEVSIVAEFVSALDQ
jgi:type III restriction enzyme